MISFHIYLFADQNNFVSVELYAYFDGSKTAYSTVIYTRTIFKDKMIVKFASATSKVVHNKGLSILKIEVLSCLLLSKLISAVVNPMSVEVVRNHLLNYLCYVC